MTTRLLHAADAGTPFARAAAHLRSALSRAELWPALAGRRASLEAGVEAIERARANLHGSLWILLLGGTGVGKSTLLNALAGEEIAPTSVRRPTTTRTTFYAHRDASLAPLGDIPPGEGKLVAHELEALRDKVVIDPPDFDSSVESNRRRLLPLVEASDLIVTIVDREKYRDEALYELLARFRGEKTFLFVMNKLDLGCPDEMLADFRSALADSGFAAPRGGDNAPLAEAPLARSLVVDPTGTRVLTVSARAALDARAAGEAGLPESTGEFAELERIVAEELDRARIREIKRANLAGMAAHVLEGFEETVGADPRGRLDGATAKCRELAESVTERLRKLFARCVLGVGGEARSDTLRGYLRRLQLLAFGGVFGLYLAVVERLRSYMGRGWPRILDRVEARALAESRMRVIDEREVGTPLAAAAAEAIAGLASAGLSAEVARARLDPARSGLSSAGLVRGAAEGTACALGALTDAALSPNRFSFRNMLFNLVPTAILLGIPVYPVYAVIRDDPFLGTPADALTLGGIALVAVSWLEGLLVERAFARGGARAIVDLENGLAMRIGAFMQERFLGVCEELAREAGSVPEEIEKAREASGLRTPDFGRGRLRRTAEATADGRRCTPIQ